MRKTLVIVALLALLVIAGCAQKGTPSPSPTSIDNDVNAVSAEVIDVESISADMNAADLDTLNQELADIQTLELQ